ncbi:hypothetical protein FOA52_006176 [Chlamydomonas sp. UWO 241]|nr:hypothetical protein FOA52_006176 [Chlamydomonas sp. UWO 241]
MVARDAADGLVRGLSASSSEERARSLRSIKNAVIGSKSKKSQFLKAGALPRVLELLLNSSSSPECVSQCATTLGSLSYGTPGGLELLLASSGLPGLVGTLNADNPRVVEAAIRALKLVYSQSSCAVPHAPVLNPATLPRVVALLGDASRPDIAEAAAVVLAAVCRSADEQRALTDAGAGSAAVTLLASDRRALQATSLRVLSRLLPRNPRAAAALLERPQLIDTLVALLRDGEPLTRFAAATCLTYLAASPPADGGPAAAGTSSDRGARAPGGGGGARARLAGSSSGLAVTEQSQPSQTPANALRRAHAAGACVAERLEAAKHAVLPVLLRLLGEPGVLEQVPPVLAKLLEGSEELQKAALDADVVRHLAALLVVPPFTPGRGVNRGGVHGSVNGGGVDAGAAGPSGGGAGGSGATAAAGWAVGGGGVSGAGGGPSGAAAADAPGGSGDGGGGSERECSGGSTLQEGVLRALGNLCLTRNDGRKQLIEAKVLKHIVRSLEHPCEGVRAAAAVCVMALSRSIPTLRSSLLEAEVAEVLCRLLSDSCVDVQVNAAATLCNLVLEFSSVKEAVLAQGALTTLAELTELTGSMVGALRLHGCWALRNLAYKSSGEVRRTLMRGLPWPAMRALLNDADADVQEQAVCTLRNLCMDSEEHIGAVLEWASADLLVCLEEKLDPSSAVPEPILQHALYTVANVLTGSDAHKDAVMASNLPALLAHHLRCPASPDLRVSAIWCIINLTWPEANPGPAATSRVRKLRELGVEVTLLGLLADANMNVQERAKTALVQFGGGSAAAVVHM